MIVYPVIKLQIKLQIKQLNYKLNN